MSSDVLWCVGDRSKPQSFCVEQWAHYANGESSRRGMWHLCYLFRIPQLKISPGQSSAHPKPTPPLSHSTAQSTPNDTKVVVCTTKATAEGEREERGKSEVDKKGHFVNHQASALAIQNLIINFFPVASHSISIPLIPVGMCVRGGIRGIGLNWNVAGLMAPPS